MEVVEGHSRLMATTAPDELYAWSEGRHILFSPWSNVWSYYVSSNRVRERFVLCTEYRHLLYVFREHPIIYLTAHQMVSGVIHSIFSLFPFLPLAHGDPIDRRRYQSLCHSRPEPQAPAPTSECQHAPLRRGH